MTPYVILTLCAVAALLVAEYRDWRVGVWIAKPLASCGFIGAALAAGGSGIQTPSDPYETWILAGLVLSLGGDVLLIPRERPAIFRLGILSFLLGHVSYVIAFASRGVDPMAALISVLLLAPPAWIVRNWLQSSVPPELSVAVHAYIAVISAMLVCAIGSVAAHGQPTIVLGAAMFYVSDLAVARDRFVAPGFINGAWGLPLYYGGQLVLASTLAG